MLQGIWDWVTADWLRTLSLFGNLILGVIAYLQWREAAHQREIEQQREERTRQDRKSAQLRAQFRTGGKSPRLQVINQGEAEACDVRVLANDVPVKEQGGFVGHGDHPIPVLAPGGSYDYLYASDKSNPNTFRIELHWKDDRGEEKWESTLKVK